MPKPQGKRPFMPQVQAPQQGGGRLPEFTPPTPVPQMQQPTPQVMQVAEAMTASDPTRPQQWPPQIMGQAPPMPEPEPEPQQMQQRRHVSSGPYTGGEGQFDPLSVPGWKLQQMGGNLVGPVRGRDTRSHLAIDTQNPLARKWLAAFRGGAGSE